jgi:hypothetical protein
MSLSLQWNPNWDTGGTTKLGTVAQDGTYQNPSCPTTAANALKVKFGTTLQWRHSVISLGPSPTPGGINIKATRSDGTTKTTTGTWNNMGIGTASGGLVLDADHG